MNTISYLLEITKELLAVLTKTLTVFLIGFLIVSCEETSTKNDTYKKIVDVEVDSQQIVLNPLEGMWYYKNKPFNGYAVSKHENGTLKTKIGYYIGKKNGASYKWFPNGVLQKESKYIDNKLEGTVTIYWNTGGFASKSNYSNGLRNGIQKKWHSNGQLARKTTFVLGKEEGMQQAWLKNGKIYINYEAKNGRTFGLKKAILCYELENELVKN